MAHDDEAAQPREHCLDLVQMGACHEGRLNAR